MSPIIYSIPYPSEIASLFDDHLRSLYTRRHLICRLSLDNDSNMMRNMRNMYLLQIQEIQMIPIYVVSNEYLALYEITTMQHQKDADNTVIFIFAQLV